jgi:asparagine synthase (glutamine-hydrolysing)
LIAVSFDPSGRTDEALLSRALAPLAAEITRHAALRLAHAGPVTAAAAGPVRCLLEGELFNRAELSRALEVSPQTPAAELVALAFGAWDLAMFARLRGTFAIAVWDAERGRGVLATDHFAVRPWYVARVQGTLLAATSMRALQQMLPGRPQPDPIRVITWLAGAFVRGGPETFATGVERLAGAHAILFEDGRATTRRWWQPVYREPLSAPRAELVEHTRAALGEAMRSRTPSGETTGVMLSGGFDSSAVVGVAASETESPGRLRTYSAVFPNDAEVDESSRVRDLVTARGLASDLIAVRPVGIFRLALEHQRDWGIPPLGPGYLLERPLLERAKQDGAQGILDGQGGDELFGFSPYLIADRVRRGHFRAALQLLASLPDQVGLPPRGALADCVREYAVRPLLPKRIERALRLRGDPTRHMPAWLRRDQINLFLQTEDHLAWKQDGDGPLWWRYRAHILTAERGGLSEYIGHRGRDLGLQMRPPLLDVDLVDLSLQLPPELAYGGINRSFARDSVAGDLPDSVRLAATKSNLQTFHHRTLSGHDLAPIRLLLEDPDARIYQYVDRSWMLKRLQAPPAVGQAGWTYWGLATWVSITAEIALRSLEDPEFAQSFIDAHEPPGVDYAEVDLAAAGSERG